VVPRRAWLRRFRTVRKEAGIEWQQDMMRHSYCSHWLAAFGDVNRLRTNVGHRSPDMLFRHYHKAVKAAEAKRFWKITPRS